MQLHILRLWQLYYEILCIIPVRTIHIKDSKTVVVVKPLVANYNLAISTTTYTKTLS